MLKNIDIENKQLDVTCNCGMEYTHIYDTDYKIKFVEEFGEYENLSLKPCPQCNSVTVININLPEEELSEDFMTEMNMPNDEKTQRRVMRKLMKELEFELVE